MTEPLINPRTKDQLEAYIRQPSLHGVIIAGPFGSGKAEIASWLAAKLLAISSDKLSTYPYFMQIEPVDDKAISVDDVRTINHFLSRKVPTKSPGINRVVIINAAEKMQTIAQNALLKNLEEPPINTVIILATADYSQLLTTVRSRCLKIQLLKPDENQLKSHLAHLGIEPPAIERIMAISGGLTGLAIDLATNQASPMSQAAETARELLSSDKYHRLLKVNDLHKNKDLFFNVVLVLKRMAGVALQSASLQQSQRWQNILDLATQTETYLKHNANLKLTILNLLNRLWASLL